MNTIVDPKQLLERADMSRFQIMVVALCVMLNALDGFDVLAISFASPGIAEEWAVNRAALGVVLAMELFGMGVGSIILGGIADRFGRRPTILACLVLMSLGMFLAVLANSVNQLLLIRFITGLGIGGMLAATNALVAEFANAKHRHFAVICMATGYPVGAVIGGSISSLLLQHYDWRSVFYFGSATTAFFLFVVWFGLPESIEHLLNKRPKNALAKINQSLQKMGHAAIAVLPVMPQKKTASAGFSTLFSEKYRSLTLLLIVGYFMHIMTFYYMLKWIPKIVVDMGYEASSAGSVLVWANLGGVVGAILLGLFSSRLGLRRLLMGVLIMSFVMLVGFGFGQNSLSGLSLLAAVTGFFTNAGVVCFYALMASSFPADVRAGGTGIVIGLGRAGAALGPVIAGFLFAGGAGLLQVSIVMGGGALIAAVAVFYLPKVIKKHSIDVNI